MEEFSKQLLLSLKNNSLYVYVFIFIVSFTESFAFLGLIVPGAAIVVTAGLLSAKGYFNIYWLMVFAIFGAVLADLASFVLGKKYFDYVTTTKIYAKYRDYFSKGEIFFKKHGGISVFFGRFIGFLRPVIPFVAGAMKMNTAAFLFWAILSGILWGAAYIGFGYLSNEGLKLLSNLFDRLDYLTAFAIILLVMIFFIRKIKR